MSSEELEIKDNQTGFTPAQMSVLQQMGIGAASQGDVSVFFHQVQRTGLDPFAHQIYMIRRGGKQTIQTGIDGFRLIARRAADAHHEMFSEPLTVWCGSDSEWHDVWVSDKPPVAAKVEVMRGEGKFTGVALYREYCATNRDGSPQSVWRDKPSVMLAKCAEALALRKAFPQDLSGLYTSDEMQPETALKQPQVVPAHDETVTGEVMASTEQRNLIVKTLKSAGVGNADDAHTVLSSLLGHDVRATSQVTEVEAEAMLSDVGLLQSRAAKALGKTS